MNHEIFIETSNVTKFRKATSNLANTEKGKAGMMVVQGSAGRGKTMCAKEWHANNDSVFLRVWGSWTEAAMWRALCFEFCGEKPRSISTSQDLILDEIHRFRRTIIIDEADRLSLKTLDNLRDLHDYTSCPMILIGEENMMTKISSMSRTSSRVVQVVKFSPVTPEDIMLYAMQAASLEVTPEACHRLAELARGSFRLVYGYMLKLEEYAKVQGENKIDMATITKLRIGRN